MLRKAFIYCNSVHKVPLAGGIYPARKAFAPVDAPIKPVSDSIKFFENMKTACKIIKSIYNRSIADGRGFLWIKIMKAVESGRYTS
ncbi:hypothetical protein DWX17_10270 [[Clostridium] innocuum]|jgi:hypothetical protein|nr:hypothetical protein DWX17_10270 [[Clostridium] innocuum]